MISLEGGDFMMGADDPESVPEDGEGPRRQVSLSPFSIGTFVVSNVEFANFVDATGYKTTAERIGWSHVFHMLLAPAKRMSVTHVPTETPWWYPVEGACWRRPEGSSSSLEGRRNHPVVHVSWWDAIAYCEWAGTTLPTEAQWEFAARGGRTSKFPWGDTLTLDGAVHCCNVWQGRFPGHNTAEDGHVGTAPVDAFAPNDYGLFNVVGNVWEWCQDNFSSDYHSVTTDRDPVYVDTHETKSARGGSFLCHQSYCSRYRLGARVGNAAGTTCSNLGFRVASV